MSAPAFPDPMVPAECDCRGLPYMPLEVVRLRDSDFALLSTGEEFKAGFLLWCASWQQVPAASLPDDDRILAKLAGLGAGEWSALRPVAMRGWVKCSDGRLYHAVIADNAMRAWTNRVGQSARAASRWTQERARKAAATDGQCPGNAVAYAPAMQGEGEGKAKGEREESLSPNGDDGEVIGKPKGYPEDFEAAWKAYPHAKGRSAKPKALAAWRKLPAQARAELPSACARYAADGKEPKADCGAPAMQRWLAEERFTDWLAADGSAAPAPVWRGPPEVRTAVIDAAGEDFAVGWLDGCQWSPSPDRAVIARNDFAAKRLEREAGRALAGLDVAIRVANQAPAKPSATDADIDAIWALTPKPGRERSGRGDVARALTAAMDRGHTAAQVTAGLAAYYATDDATRDEARFAKGVHRMIEGDRWQSFAPADAASMPESRWKHALAYWHRDGSWDDKWGPKPGEPGCQAPAHMLLRVAA